MNTGKSLTGSMRRPTSASSRLRSSCGASGIRRSLRVQCGLRAERVARAVRAPGGEISETAQLQLEFWTGLVETMSERDSSFNVPKIGAHHWCDLRIGTSRGHISLTALRNGRMSCDLYLGHSQSGFIYEQLKLSGLISKPNSVLKVSWTGNRCQTRRVAGSRSTRKLRASTTASSGRRYMRGCWIGLRSSEPPSPSASRTLCSQRSRMPKCKLRAQRPLPPRRNLNSSTSRDARLMRLRC